MKFPKEVNGSGQFVGVAEMMGQVVFDKDMDFWQLDMWSGFFPVQWHIVKDIHNQVLRHIILEDNDNRPVTYTRDTQEVSFTYTRDTQEVSFTYNRDTQEVSFHCLVLDAHMPKLWILFKTFNLNIQVRKTSMFIEHDEAIVYRVFVLI